MNACRHPKKEGEWVLRSSLGFCRASAGAGACGPVCGQERKHENSWRRGAILGKVLRAPPAVCFHFFNILAFYFLTLQKGFEPLTNRLTVDRSTN